MAVYSLTLDKDLCDMAVLKTNLTRPAIHKPALQLIQLNGNSLFISAASRKSFVLNKFNLYDQFNFAKKHPSVK